MDKIQNYVKRKASKKTKDIQFIYGGIKISYKDEFENEVSLEGAIKKIRSLIPKKFLTRIDLIYVGAFPFLQKRNINAMYEGGLIYLSNEQEDQEDLVDDLIHEIAHAVEAAHGKMIYHDGRLETEFLNKRKKLYQTLGAYKENPPEKALFYDIDYNKKLDDYFYKKIGYEKLQHFVMGVFPSTYSTSSLKEYFAIGFEMYYLDGPNNLKDCKVLLEKIGELDDAKS
jgi:hypothetical protein